MLITSYQRHSKIYLVAHPAENHFVDIFHSNLNLKNPQSSLSVFQNRTNICKYCLRTFFFASLLHNGIYFEDLVPLDEIFTGYEEQISDVVPQ